MQDIFDSVRRSLVFRSPEGEEGREVSLAEKIGTCIRRSRVGFFSKASPPSLPPPPPPPPPISKDAAPSIRWRRGELIGCGAFGRVYMGMNLDSGELLAVKQVLIAPSNASKEKAQTHIRELEEEVKLLKNLSHPNIVRYLGTAREEETLNILLEFVPGGSISSLLGEFGSFPEAVIRMYTKQLLQGLEYLHNNGIMHRDIKGANILVDNKGCIKLADFGASKQVVELATVTGAKSMKGTPYWMAPEVILQTGHSFSADIWSVGCTVIEMATGKPPWSQQYQEVAALFHIGTTKSHPPIPEHLSFEAKDFLLKCLQKEPNLRPSASDLLQHSFVTGEYKEPHPMSRSSVPEHSATMLLTSGSYPNISPMALCSTSSDACNIDGARSSTIFTDKLSTVGPMWETNASDEMCQVGDDFVVDGVVRPDSPLMFDNVDKSYNPISEPDDWPCQFDESPVQREIKLDDSCDLVNGAASSFEASVRMENDFTFPCETTACEDEDEVTETKIRAFLDEKALDLKKLQTPLYEEFYNSLNVAVAGNIHNENAPNYLKLPPKSRSPSRVVNGTSTAPVDAANTTSPSSCSKRVSNSGRISIQSSREVPSAQHEWRDLVDTERQPDTPSQSYTERQRKWKEELDRELERKREMMRQAGVGMKTSPKDKLLNRQKDRSPKDIVLNQQKDRLRNASPGK
ncbi:hypothetical protein AAC387_Pa10g1242 [Persea americana]